MSSPSPPPDSPLLCFQLPVAPSSSPNRSSLPVDTSNDASRVLGAGDGAKPRALEKANGRVLASSSSSPSHMMISRLSSDYATNVVALDTPDSKDSASNLPVLASMAKGPSRITLRIPPRPHPVPSSFSATVRSFKYQPQSVSLVSSDSSARPIHAHSTTSNGKTMARFTTNVSSSSSPFAQIARKKVLKKRVREDSSNGESDDFDSSENNNGDSTDSENDEYDGMSAAAIKKKKKIAALAVIKAKLASVAQPRKKMRSVLADSDDSGEDSWGSGDDDAAYGASRKKPKAKAGDRNDYYEQGDGFVVGSDVFVVGSDEEEPPVWVNSQDSDDASGSSRARPSRQARTRKLVKSVDLLLDDDDEVLGPGMVSAEASNHVSSDDVVFVGSLPATSTKPPAPIVIFSDEDSSFSSEEEQAVSDNESGDNEEFGADDNYEQSTEDETLQFFNTATKDQMQEILQVSPEQARLLISGRPFYEMHNLETHARRTKGIGFKIVEMYQSSLRGYMAVDDLIRRVEAVGMELLDVVRGWTAAPAPPLPSPTSTTTKTETITDLVKQDIEPIDVDQEKDDGALHIVEVDDSVVAGQPDIVAPGIILKHYQLIGVSWLNLLWKKKLSGILADEMVRALFYFASKIHKYILTSTLKYQGLGKTAQVIAFLGSLLEKGEKGIHLIIVPSSTLDNWVREFNKFCPSLIVRVYYGTQQERVYQGYELKDPETEYHVLITTYNLATGQKNDRVLFRKLNVKSLILDEGHLVKNSQALRYKYLMEIPAKFRLLLTGTPLYV